MDLSRINSFFQAQWNAHPELYQRAGDIALPLLKLHKPTSALISLGKTGIEIYSLSKKTREHWKSNKPQQAAFSAMRCLGEVVVLGTLISSPSKGEALSMSLCLGEHAVKLAIHASGREADLFVREALQAGCTAIRLYSTINNAPIYITLSVMAQSLAALKKSYNFYDQGKWVEALVQLFVITVRVNQAAPHFSRARWQYFGKEITQSEMSDLIKRVDALNQHNVSTKVDLESLLKEKNFSNVIKNISFSRSEIDRYYPLSDMKISYIQFKNCNFSSSGLNFSTIDHTSFNRCNFVESLFRDNLFVDTIFRDCDFNRSQWLDSEFGSSSFDGCKLLDSLFLRDVFKQVSFNNSSFFGANIHDSSMSQVHWTRSDLSETVFSNVQALMCSVKESKLIDTVLSEAERGMNIYENNIQSSTKPVISVAWNFECEGAYAKQIAKKLNENGMLPLKYHVEPKSIDQEALAREVEEGIELLRQEGVQQAKSIGEALLIRAAPNSEIDKINRSVRQLILSSDAHILPGGEDIDSRFYRANVPLRSCGWSDDGFYTPMMQNSYEDSYIRTITEMAMLHQAELADQKVLGICRGAQMINVFYGGTLQQDVAGQADYQMVIPLSAALPKVESRRQELFGKDSLCALSMHHQCAERLGNDLHLTFINAEGIPKGWMDSSGRVVAVQFHPEVYDREIYGRLKNAYLRSSPIWKKLFASLGSH